MIPKRPRILVAGLGNTLLHDGGIGIYAVNEIFRLRPPGVMVVNVGTDILSYVDWFEAAEKILAIDAMPAGGSPGTIYACGNREIRERGLPPSLPQLRLLAVLSRLPKGVRREVTLLGVEPERVAPGFGLSPVIQSRIPRLIQFAREILHHWKRELSWADRSGRPGQRFLTGQNGVVSLFGAGFIGRSRGGDN